MSRNRPMAPPTPDPPLGRIGFLCARWPRQPFTMQLTKHYCRLDRLPVYYRIDMDCALPIESENNPSFVAYFPAVCDAISNTNDAPDASASSQTTKRFLRIDDPDITRLLRRNKDDWRELPRRYFLRANEIRRDVDLFTTLANAVGKKAHEWIPQEDEIHVLALVCYNPNSNPIASLKDWTPYSHFCFGSDADRWFHSPRAVLPIQTHLVRVLQPANASHWPFSALPAFDRIVLRRRRCQCMVRKKSEPPTIQTLTPSSSAPVSPPSLLQLTEDAAFHALLTQPPQCVDPVDCVVDAALYLGDSRTPVLDNVLCFLKFERFELVEPDVYNRRWGHYVNPKMLETLNAIAQAADPFRPRLLVFVKEAWTAELCVEQECIPSAFPSIVTSWNPIAKKTRPRETGGRKN